MNQNEMTKNLLTMVKQDTVAAIGCTEPVAVAYAGAVARDYLNGDIESVDIKVSKNIFKNGKSVTIPSTDEWGLDLAAALGILGGNSKDGLMVLKDINDDIIEAAHKILKEERVKVDWVDNVSDIYINIRVISSKEKIEVELVDSHNHIEWVKVDGEIVYKGKLNQEDKISSSFLKDMKFKQIREICETIPIEEIMFIEEGIKMNKKAAERGINEDKGLGIGSAYKNLQKDGKLSKDASMQARILTAAAADIRMGGGDCPIMTSGGSGNQGLGVILPIVVVAEENNIENEKLIRAVFFGHIINKYVKLYTGKLSAMCGCAIAAGIGASAGISWILGGDDEQISGACQNMLSNLTGMICDGAKETCAFKLSTSAGEAILSAYLSNEGIIAKPNVGIIGDSIEDTIKNVGFLCRDGFVYADTVITDIIE